MVPLKSKHKKQFGQTRQVYHGNPNINLPCNSQGDTIYLVCRGSSLPVWISHKLSNQQSLCVDVWDGRFCGDLEHVAVLPPGIYRVERRSQGTASSVFEHFKVENVSALKYDFQNPDHYTRLSKQYMCKGNWQQTSAGIQALSDDSLILNKASMHGSMSSSFTLPLQTSAGQWGFIARHYNAFNHLRVICSRIDNHHIKVSLAKYNNTPPDRSSHVILAEASLKFDSRKKLLLRWDFNGSLHKVLLQNKMLFSAVDGYMGGVDIVGLWAKNPEVVFHDLNFSTTQNVPSQTVETSEYKAQIRPGNIETLCFKDKGKVAPNICWESGIQFGHIGGSEIKFTQRSRLQTTEDGSALTSVTWQGPMPKFVEQSSDVRGLAYGQAYFYQDRIVIDDSVLPWVKRSIGPDLDIFKPLLAGDLLYVHADERSVKTWKVADDGQFSWLKSNKQRFPMAILLPLRLGKKTCFLKVLILLRRPVKYDQAVFAWHCPSGLGASYDFRVAPNEPGVEHAFTIAIEFLKNVNIEQAKTDLLLMRDAWLKPPKINAVHGRTIVYDNTKEQPKTALDCVNCFDLSSGMYQLKSLDGKIRIEFDPVGITRKNLVFKINGVANGAIPKIWLNRTEMKLKRDFNYQLSFNCQDAYIYFCKDIDRVCSLTFLWN